MNKILSILSFVAVLLFMSCSNQGQNKQPITKKGAVEKLEQVIEKFKGKDEKITPSIALNAILEIYNSKRTITETNEKPIDLYVIYDYGYWQENRESETFEITFAHQVVEEPNGPLYEYRITMIYDTQLFEGIKEFDLRYSRDKDDLDSYKGAIMQSNGFKMASSTEAKRIEIIKEDI